VRSPGLASDTDVADRILRALRRILRRVSSHSRAIGRATGLTIPQHLCLRALAAHAPGPATAADLGRALQVSAPTTSRLLDRLEDAGMIRRKRDRKDRRRVFLTLTEEGRARIAQSPEPLQEEFVRRLRGRSAARRRELLRALETIVELLEATSMDASPVLTPEVEVRESPPREQRPRRTPPG